MSHPPGMLNMNQKIDDSRQGRESPVYGYAPVETHQAPSRRSPSLSTSSTRTPPSTPATSRTEPTISRPRPPRRHTDKPTLHRLPSSQFPPPFTKKSPIFDRPGLCPTTDPYTERSYLTQALQEQGERATRLLGRLTAAEERLALDEACHATGERRRLRKSISLLKKDMAKNAQQERLTLLRLGDLYVEIQTRERWVHLQQQRLAALMAQQQQPYYPRVFAYPVVDRPAEEMAGPSPVEQTAHMAEEPCPPPPPPTAVPWFSSFPPLSPSTSSCLSPLSPSFRPGMPFEMNKYWSSRRRDSSPLGLHGDGSDASALDEKDEDDDRGRSQTPAGPMPNRTISLPRMSGSGQDRVRESSVPAARIAWADEVAAAEEVSQEA